MGILTKLFRRRNTAPAPEAHMIIDEGFVDIHLPIADYRVAHSGAMSLRARGTLGKRTVGFAADLDGEWRKQSPGDSPVTFWWGNGRIRSIGSESDALIAVLAEAYGLPSPTCMAQSVRVTVVALNSDPCTFKNELAHIKMFFEHDDPEHYAEAFLKFDVVRGFASLCDKDPEYHAGLLASLSGAQNPG